MEEDQQRIWQKSEADIRLFRMNFLNRLTEESAWNPSLEELREKYYLHAGEGIFQGFLVKVDCEGEISRAGMDLILGKVQGLWRTVSVPGVSSLWQGSRERDASVF